MNPTERKREWTYIIYWGETLYENKYTRFYHSQIRIYQKEKRAMVHPDKFSFQDINHMYNKLFNKNLCYYNT